MKYDDAEDQVYYLVYKTSDDRHGGIEDLYGWSHSKSVVNAFLKQRNPKKYVIDKMVITADKSGAYSKRGLVDTRYLDLSDPIMLNILPLKSCNTGETVKLFTTSDEQIRIVSDIDSMFDQLRSFDRVEDTSIAHLVNIYKSIKPKYINALEWIGYNPTEISYLYDTVDDIYNEINFGQDYIDESDDEIDKGGLNLIKAMFYSLESVIKVLKDELI
jgi:hypothetical protein